MNSLWHRGRTGERLVIADPHSGLVAASSKAFRCCAQ